MKRLEVLVVVGLIASGSLTAAAPPKLLEADWMQREDLASTTSTAVSPDGKHVYAAAFAANSVLAFKRTAKGKLEHVQTLTAADGDMALQAAVAVRLSPDGKRAVCASFGGSTVTLFDRDAESGKLTILDTAEDMGFCIEVALSPDGKNVYVASSGSVKVLSVGEGGKLKEVQDFSAALKPFVGSRGVQVSGDGKNVYASAAHSNELLVFKRVDEGKVELLERVTDVVGLKGVHTVSQSADGKNLYTVSGRVGGTDAVCGFARGGDGKLTLIEEFISGGKGGLEGFEGGNEIAVSPDGTLVYAVASLSDTLARFTRDPATGKLTFIASIPVGEMAQPGSAGISFSPDSKFCYVADEAAGAIWAYRHKPAE